MADLLVRQADIGDVEDIYEIENLCFPDPWSRKSLAYELEQNRSLRTKW